MERILFIGDRFDDFGGEGRKKGEERGTPLFSAKEKKRERERDIDESGGLSKSRLDGIPTNFIITDPLRHQSLQLEPNGFMLNR